MHFIKEFHRWLEKRKISFEEFKFSSDRASGDTECFYAQGKLDRPLVVVLHSTGCDKYTPLIAIYKSLLQSGHSVFAFDLDGHGRGSTHLLHRKNILNGGAAVLVDDALDALKTRIDFDKVVLLGQSIGGSIAIDYCHQVAPKYEVEKLICIATPLELDIAQVSALKEVSSVGQPSIRSAFKTYGFAGIVPAIGSFRRSVWPVRCRPRGWKAVSYVDEAVAIINGLKLVEKSKVISQPTFWVSGEWDTIAQGHPQMKSLYFVEEPHECHFSLLYSESFLVELKNFLN